MKRHKEQIYNTESESFRLFISFPFNCILKYLNNKRFLILRSFSKIKKNHRGRQRRRGRVSEREREQEKEKNPHFKKGRHFKEKLLTNR